MSKRNGSQRPVDDEQTRQDTRSASAGIGVARGQEMYLDSVASRAVARAGRNPQIKGHVQEIMFVDKLNSNPIMRAQGVEARLTRSTTAQTSDIVKVRPGKPGVVERIQIKDVTSGGGVRQFGKQATSGKYNRATLKASPETIKQIRKTGVECPKAVQSTGVSSDTSTRVATRTGAKVRGNDLTRVVTRDIGRASGNAALVSAGVQVVVDVVTGERNAKQIATGAAHASGEAGAKTAAALSVRQGAIVAAERVGSETIKKVVRGSGATTVIFAAVEQIADTGRLCAGTIDPDEYARRSGANVGGSAAAYGGAVLGTAICPGIGTVIGGLVGGLAGSSLGRGLVKWFQE